MLAAAAMVTVGGMLSAQVPPGIQFAELGKRHLPLRTDCARAIVCGDVDGDGDLDLVVGNHGQQNRLYLNLGAGVFTDATAGRMPVDSDLTTSLDLGDVDGDGDLDLVIGNGEANSGQQSRLYLNNGTGTYADATASQMPVLAAPTYAVKLGDVDGDGDLDLVVGNGGTSGQQDRLYLNSGSGTFADATAGRMPADNDQTMAVILGDVDGDGDLDLVIGNWGQSRLYRNAGNGTFTDATAGRLPLFQDSTNAVALGDLDGDSDLDLVIGNAGYPLGQPDRLYLNNGTGTFADAPGQLPVHVDETRAVVLGDVDADGDLDIVLGNQGIAAQRDHLYLNNGTGTFTDASGRMPWSADRTSSLALGDVDGDGDRDLVFGNCWQPNRLCLNDGTGAFADATAPHLPLSTDEIAAFAFGDLDRDGDLDMVVGSTTTRPRIWLSDGTGVFADATANRVPVGADRTTAVALGDVDGDGDLDLVLGNLWMQSRLLLNDGAGTFTDATATHLPVGGDRTHVVGFGDIDGDGDLDLVIGNSGQQSRLYLNSGTGVFTDATATRMPAASDSTHSLWFGDVDGDSDLDLVVGNYGQQNRLFLNNGAGTFTDATATHLPPDVDLTTSVSGGDVDGDGDLDLVIGNGGYTWRQSRLYRNNGNGSFVDATATQMPMDGEWTTSTAFGDVDGDGDLDLVLGKSSAPDLLYLNTGAGTFVAAGAGRMPTESEGSRLVRFADVDRDGDLDLVVVTQSHSRLLVNLQRQLDARYLLRAGSAYSYDVYSRFGPPSALDLALPYLATTRVAIPVPPYGMLGIDPLAPLALVQVAQPAGVGTAVATVPNSPALVGIEIFAQALLLQANTDLRLTNVTADVIVR